MNRKEALRILNLPETASLDEIKDMRNFKLQAYHPDKHKGEKNQKIATAEAIKINEAYETLGDDSKRQEYDMTRNNPFTRMNSHGGGGMEVPIDDIFNMFFGGAGGPFGFPGMQQGFPGMPPGAKVHVFHGGPMGFQQAMQKPIPILKTITINMEQVLSGASIPLEIERWIMENGLHSL